jgi:hypothetical protein
MKKIVCGLLTLISLNAFALEGCEVIGRSGTSAYRNGATTAKNYSIEKCAKELMKVVVEGNWDEAAAQHADKEGNFTHFKFERTTREEFFRIRNN